MLNVLKLSLGKSEVLWNFSICFYLLLQYEVLSHVTYHETLLEVASNQLKNSGFKFGNNSTTLVSEDEIGQWHIYQNGDSSIAVCKRCNPVIDVGVLM